MKKLTVIGWPINHTLSPKMHGAALKAAELDHEFSYEKVAIEPGKVPEFLDRIRAGEFVGTNVTIPHKIPVFDGVDERDDTAELIGACNTVVRLEDGRLRGYNTDAYGAFNAVESQTGVSAKGKHVLIIGAGGAARACAAGGALEGANKITILNRTLEKAEQIIADLIEKKPEWKTTIEWSAINKPTDKVSEAEIIMQMTNLGMKEGDPLPLDPDLLKESCVVLEAVYVPVWTAFRTACHERGLTTVDGRAMLVGQGAVSFELWTGVKPDLKVMTEAIC